MRLDWLTKPAIPLEFLRTHFRYSILCKQIEIRKFNPMLFQDIIYLLQIIQRSWIIAKWRYGCISKIHWNIINIFHHLLKVCIILTLE